VVQVIVVLETLGPSADQGGRGWWVPKHAGPSMKAAVQGDTHAQGVWPGWRQGRPASCDRLLEAQGGHHLPGSCCAGTAAEREGRKRLPWALLST